MPDLPLKTPESAVLKSTMEYLGFEQLWCMRAPAGRARVGGQPIKLPVAIFALVGKLLDGRKIRRRLWDGCIRIGEQWLPLASKGTPDIIVSIPANRTVFDEGRGQYVKAPVARIAYIETKRSHGGRLSPDQKKFREDAMRRGELFYVVSDMDHLRKMIPPKFELGMYGPTKGDTVGVVEVTEQAKRTKAQ